MNIDLSKENMEAAFLAFLHEIFCLSEVSDVTVKDVFITRETVEDTGRRAFDASYHDAYSDIDLSVKVRLPNQGPFTPETYMARINRYGETDDTALGWMFVPENAMYRVVFKNGMRYDIGFRFEYADDAVLDLGKSENTREENKHWPLENIHRFWFIQIQALGKLYRKDHLISAHLANMNCNDTLVMQMVMRDLTYGTNFHRYGYAEELEYIKDLGKMPYKMKDPVSRQISDHLYAAALTYDRQAKYFYSGYKDRSSLFFAIWDAYETFTEKM